MAKGTARLPHPNLHNPEIQANFERIEELLESLLERVGSLTEGVAALTERLEVPAPGPREARVLGTEYTPNKERLTLVAIDVSVAPSPGFGKAVDIFVGGTKIAPELFIGGQNSPESGYRIGASFLVPKGVTWRAIDGTGSGGITDLHSSYTTLY
jgi:hypothetical protein